MPTSPSPPPNTESSRLKRRIATLQQELNEVKGLRSKKSPTAVTMGRGIRRLVVLFDSIDAMISEADYRIQAEEDGSQLPDVHTDEEAAQRINADRIYKGYTLLLSLIPDLRTLLEDPESDIADLEKLQASLQKGANDARSDDVRRIKEELGGWLNADYSPSTPFPVKSRSERGLQNDVTGRLLCPIELDWDDEGVRNEIRAGSLTIADDFFLSCLYPKGKGDPAKVEKNFLRSNLLVKTFCAIFTSPTSSESVDIETETDEGPSRKRTKTDSQKKSTKANVATLLRMEGKVTPRSIAYAATLLVFNLTDATQWADSYNGFSFPAFYHFIVDYFELAADPQAKLQINNLLKWWNKQIFPCQPTHTLSFNKSRDRLASQRLQNGQA